LKFLRVVKLIFFKCVYKFWNFLTIFSYILKTEHSMAFFFCFYRSIGLKQFFHAVKIKKTSNFQIMMTICINFNFFING